MQLVTRFMGRWNKDLSTAQGKPPFSWWRGQKEISPMASSKGRRYLDSSARRACTHKLPENLSIHSQIPFPSCFQTPPSHPANHFAPCEIVLVVTFLKYQQEYLTSLLEILQQLPLALRIKSELFNLAYVRLRDLTPAYRSW